VPSPWQWKQSACNCLNIFWVVGISRLVTFHARRIFFRKRRQGGHFFVAGATLPFNRSSGLVCSGTAFSQGRLFVRPTVAFRQFLYLSLFLIFFDA
jgi:hypothetical protein